jgi:hypothetical protein
MGANQAYTQQMKAATSPNGTGDNPKIGISVSYHHSSSYYCFLLSCTPCVQPSPSPPPPSSQACTDSALGTLPNEDTRAHALPALHMLPTSEGLTFPCVRKWAGKKSNPKPQLNPYPTSNPNLQHSTNPNPSRSVSWSFPVVTAAVNHFL